MKKVITLFLSIVLLTICLVSCEEECDHSGSDWVVATPATCIAAGLNLLECNKCGEQRTKTVPATGHNWDDATCNDAKTCKTCKITEGDPLGHDYSAEVTLEATCLVDGIEKHTCARCSDSYETAISHIGHTNEHQDSGEDICSVCGETSYSTYSALTLAVVYQKLLAPDTATINSVYAGLYEWDNSTCVVVIPHVTAQATAGGMVDKEYIVMFDLTDGSMTFDVLGIISAEIDKDNGYVKYLSGEALINCLDRLNNNLDKRISLYELLEDKSKILQKQNVNLIEDYAKELSGVFNKE